jgi:hypothetical protein
MDEHHQGDSAGKRDGADRLSITHIFSKRIGELQILLASVPRS